MNYHKAVIELMKARPFLSVTDAKYVADELFSVGNKRRSDGCWVFRFSYLDQPWQVMGDESAIHALVARFKQMGAEP